MDAIEDWVFLLLVSGAKLEILYSIFGCLSFHALDGVSFHA